MTVYMLKPVADSSVDYTAQAQRAVEMLEAAGLRATAHRVMLLSYLNNAGGNNHFSAEAVYDYANRNGNKISLATVYNTLRSFTDVGLLDQVTPDSTRVYFDTNIKPHHHFYNESTGVLEDIDASVMHGVVLPQLPTGTCLKSVELMVRITEKPN